MISARERCLNDGYESGFYPVKCFPVPLVLYLISHCPFLSSFHGLVNRSARIAIGRPRIMGAGTFSFVWLQTVHGAALGKRRIAATRPASSAPTFMPNRLPRPATLPDGSLQSSL